MIGGKSPQLTEKDITKQIRDLLNTIPGLYHWKAWQGPMSQPRGVSDIIGVYNGIFFAIEIKKPGGKATPYQTAFINRVREAGGIAFVAWDIETVITGLGLPVEIKKCNPLPK